jgi:hypothetical protein
LILKKIPRFRSDTSYKENAQGDPQRYLKIGIAWNPRTPKNRIGGRRLNRYEALVESAAKAFLLAKAGRAAVFLKLSTLRPRNCKTDTFPESPTGTNVL